MNKIKVLSVYWSKSPQILDVHVSSKVIKFKKSLFLPKVAEFIYIEGENKRVLCLLLLELKILF